ncbi:RHS repeat-associated core domain-containing protein [uncultured Pseudoteredinibacter sp.]|uniref:RHS repeat-associated core domain-containing protein n=1 Tax=uncultured Pseudoteredinibacter sp. TaxID=1641701 RepID=UPI00261A5CE2|nr:RHS repeat-associated core domain-containing protein [uncultured Pseudoteredinibacter sp.]
MYFFRFSLFLTLLLSLSGFSQAYTLKGNYEGISGTPSLFGWACQVDKEQAIAVHFYVGGRGNYSTFFGGVVASRGGERGIATTCSTSNSNFRFNWTPSTSKVQQYCGNYITGYAYNPAGSKYIGSHYLACPPKPSAVSYFNGPSSAYSGENVYLNWGSASGSVDRYQVDYKTPTGNWFTIHYSGSRSKTYNVSGGGTHQFRVMACYKGQCGSKKYHSVSVSPKPSAVGNVSGPSSVEKGGSITLNWGAARGTVDKYQVDLKKPGQSRFTIHYHSSRSKTYQMDTVGANEFRIMACYQGQCGPYKYHTVNVTQPQPPGSVSSFQVSPTTLYSGQSVSMSWGAASSGTVDDYQVDYKSPSASSWTTIHHNPSRSKQYVVNGGGTHQFRVRACNGTVCSASVARSVTVLKPGNVPNFTLTPGDLLSTETVQLSWGQASGVVDKYQVDYKAAGASSWTTIFSQNQRTWQHQVQGAGVHYFRVWACNNGVCSSSTEASVNVSMPMPRGNFEGFVHQGAPEKMQGWACMQLHESPIQVQFYQGEKNDLSSPIFNVSPSSAGEVGIANSCHTQNSNFRFTKVFSASEMLQYCGKPISGYAQHNGQSKWIGTHSTECPEVELRGSFEGLVNSNHKQLQGWACQRDNEDPISVDFYAAAKDDTSPNKLIHTLLPNIVGEAGIATSCNTQSTRFRFKWQMPDSMLNQYCLNKTRSGEISAYAKVAGKTKWIGTHHLICPGLEGNFEGYNPNDSREFVGWACDVDNEESITVRFYTGEPNDLGELVGGASADKLGEEGIGLRCATENTNFRFAWKLSEEKFQEFCGQDILGYAISNIATGQPERNKLIGRRTLTCDAGIPTGFKVNPTTVSINQPFELSWNAGGDNVSSYKLYELLPGTSEWLIRYEGPNTNFSVGQKSTAGEYKYRVQQCTSATSCSGFAVLTVDIGQSAGYSAISELLNGNLARDDQIRNTDKVGTLGGAFRVNESGAATYNVPVAAPAGTAGVVPQVSLSYSSQAGNGLMGLGWSINGLSSISRCRQTLHQDRQALAIEWNANDRFCLDGQRLVVVSGSYGEANSEYKTEIDSFTTVTAVGGTSGDPEYFTVERKDGSISFYGKDNDTRKSKQLGVNNKTLSWGISEFQDSLANPIKFFYENNGNGQGQRIDQIRYAYGSGHYHSAYIDFEYQDRDDYIRSNIAGATIKQDKRLARVVSYNDHDYNGSFDIVRSYSIAYQFASQVGTDSLSRVAKITDCVDPEVSDTCLAATSFTWELPVSGFSSASSSIDLSEYKHRYLFNFKPADINGDGYTDLVWLDIHNNVAKMLYAVSNQQGGFVQGAFKKGTEGLGEITTGSLPNDKEFPLEVLDYNADGRMDVATYNGSEWQVYLSVPVETAVGVSSWRLNYYALDTGLTEKEAQFVDVNSDGLADAVYLSKVGSNRQLKVRYLQRSSSQSFSSSQFYQWGAEYHLATFAAGSDTQKLMAGEVNGDGRIDFLVTDLENKNPQTAKEFVLASTADGSYSVETYTSPVAQGVERQYRLQDVNSDGLADLIDNNSLYLADGEGGFSTAAIALHSNVEIDGLQLADYNHDGYTDLIWPNYSTNKVQVAIWNNKLQNFVAPAGIADITGGSSQSHLFFDMSGDGSLDYIRLADEDLITRQGLKTSPFNLVKSITNGLGARTTINYQTMSQSDHYIRKDLWGIINEHYSPERYIDWSTGNRIAYRSNVFNDVNTIPDFYSYLNKSSWNVNNDSHSLDKSSVVLELRAPISLVTTVASSAPIANSNNNSSSINYYYAGAKLQAAGRGLLGFDQLITEDMQTRVKTHTHYRQDWPFIGYPMLTETRTQNGALLSRAENIWKLKGFNKSSWQNTIASSGTASLGAVKPYIAKSIEESYNLMEDLSTTGARLSKVETNTSYDDFGNPTEISVETTGRQASEGLFRTTTINEYNGSLTLLGRSQSHSYRELGRLTKATVTKQRYKVAGDSTPQSESTRVSAFEYRDLGKLSGLLDKEIIEPGQLDFELITEHRYDDFGNKIGAKQTAAADNNTRCALGRTTYDTYGRYMVSQSDCLGRKVQSIDSRNKFGAPLRTFSYTNASSLNSIETVYAYTPRGLRYGQASESGSWSIDLLTNFAGECGSTAVYRSISKTSGGAKSEVCFDSLGRQVEERALGFAVDQWISKETQYDNLGRVKRVSEPSYEVAKYWTSNEYDLLGRVKRVTAPNGSISTIGYKNYTTTTTVTRTGVNAADLVKRERKNVLGELTEVFDYAENSVATDSIGTRLAYGYDSQGNLSVVDKHTNQATVTVEISYDLLGRKKSMNDPDKGHWKYEYNPFGELTKQTDAEGNVSQQFYDGLGRLESRQDYDSQGDLASQSEWVYDTAINGLGQLDYVTHDNVKDSALDNGSRQQKTFYYDEYGRQESVKTEITIASQQTTHYEKQAYDQYGRLKTVHDASRVGDDYSLNGLRYHYNQNGYRYKLSGDVNGVNQDFQTITSMDARGNITNELLGDGNVVERTYEEDMGRLKTLEAGGATATTIQDSAYAWDNIGNLLNRVDIWGDKKFKEEFTYDALNRLKSYKIESGTGSDVSGDYVYSNTIRYDAFGNILYKSDVCSSTSNCYYYGPGANGNGGPHALRHVNGGNYHYDKNGNNTYSDGRTISYTSFNKVKTIVKGANKIGFDYGADRSRYARIDGIGGAQQKITLYLGSVEKTYDSAGVVSHKRYIGGLAIVNLSESNGVVDTVQNQLRYIYKDHLGSTDVITDENGHILQEFSFDAFGARRTPGSWQDMFDVLNALHSVQYSVNNLITNRGYTGHEMLDDVGIIHMNGRIYDPRVARFLQADPFVQAASDTQMYNRYSYVRNNPLNATDPSGYFVFTLAAGIYLAAAEVTKLWVVGLVMGAAGFADALAQGASFGDALKSGIIQGISAAAFGAVSEGFSWAKAGFGEGFAQVMKLGTIGGITSVLQGGKFGHGFASAGLSAPAGHGLSKLLGAGPSARVISQIVVGGTVSKATGGKFANGATTAAFASLFSELAQGGSPAKEGTPGDQSSQEQKNLTEAQAEFRRLYEAGLLPEEFNFINDLEGGLDNPALSFKYVDRAVPGRVAEMDIYDYTGATVYRGGASSLTVALDTVAHEIYHMHPTNQRLWKGGGFGKNIAQSQAVRMGRRTVEVWKENP